MLDFERRQQCYMPIKNVALKSFSTIHVQCKLFLSVLILFLFTEEKCKLIHTFTNSSFIIDSSKDVFKQTKYEITFFLGSHKSIELN